MHFIYKEKSKQCLRIQIINPNIYIILQFLLLPLMLQKNSRMIMLFTWIEEVTNMK